VLLGVLVRPVLKAFKAPPVKQAQPAQLDLPATQDQSARPVLLGVLVRPVLKAFKAPPVKQAQPAQLVQPELLV
ncbi:MAG: hypothetical protein ACYCZF_17095, partial [Anaerolineae bacterium]